MGSAGRDAVRRHERELDCSRCRSVIAWVWVRPLALVRVRDTCGCAVTPLGGAVAQRVAETRLADALAAERAGEPLALDPYRGVLACRRDLDHLRRQAGELVYESSCP